MKRLFAVVVSLAFVTGALVVNAATPQQSGPRYIDMPDRSDDLPYSHLVVAGNTVYLSGTIGVDPETGMAPDDIDVEIRLVLDSVRDRLAHVGLTMDNLVSVEVFCPDLSLYERFNAVYATYFEQNHPARAFVGSGPLLRNGHFEVKGIAVIP